MQFECELKIENEIEKWSGKVKKFINYGSHYEVFIESRSSILVLLGRTTSGGFACMPDFQVGCHIVGLDDIFWNTEKLTAILGKVDGITVATALHKLYQKCII